MNRSVQAALLCIVCVFVRATEHAPDAAAGRPAAATRETAAALKALPSKVSEDEVEILDESARANKYLDLAKTNPLEKYQVALESARSLKSAKELKRSEAAFVQLLEGRAPDEIKRPALLDLAMVMQELREPTKAQQLFSEYIRRFPNDASAPEVLLRQAYLYRDMGVPVLALSKFYAVISTALNLKLDRLDYYQKLVLRAQAEIAETYFLEDKYAEAADYFNRLLRLESEDLDRSEALYKLARCYSALGKDNEAVATARTYLDKYPESADAAETRFLLASGLKRLGRTDDAIREIGELLKAQHQSAKADPRQWRYWQQRAGNEIANQLYREGDFINSLQVYNLLANLDSSAEWQVPVLYQIGLTFEQLKQPDQAKATYEKVIARYHEESKKAPSPALQQVSEMAAWRRQLLQWESSAQAANRELQNSKGQAL
jgi:TolA-binding protein